MSKKKTKKKKQHNRYLALTSIPFQMGSTIFLGAYLGESLDKKYIFDKKYFTIAFVLIAVFASLYLVIKQLKNLEDE